MNTTPPDARLRAVDPYDQRRSTREHPRSLSDHDGGEAWRGPNSPGRFEVTGIVVDPLTTRCFTRRSPGGPSLRLRSSDRGATCCAPTFGTLPRMLFASGVATRISGTMWTFDLLALTSKGLQGRRIRRVRATARSGLPDVHTGIDPSVPVRTHLGGEFWEL